MNKTYFGSYDLLKAKLEPIPINEIEFGCFLYIENANMLHVNYATFLNKGVAFVQYSDKFIDFSSFIDALFTYAMDDELSIELEEWDAVHGSGYKEKIYREKVWQYIGGQKSFSERIEDLAHDQLKMSMSESNYVKQVDQMQMHQSFVENWYSYFNGVFGIEPDKGDDANKNGQSELEKSWDNENYSG